MRGGGGGGCGRQDSTVRFRSATTMTACVCNPGNFAARDYAPADWECTGCPNEDACLGGTADSPRGTCSEGYRGEWCQTCAQDWFAFEVECIRCPSNPGLRIIIFVTLMLLFVVCMVKVSTMVAEDKSSSINVFKGCITPLAILLTRGQTLGAITMMDANWPKFVLRAAWLVLHMANVDLPSVVYPECQYQFETVAGVLVFRVVFNAVLYLIVCLFIFLIFLVYACQKYDYSSLINGIVAAFCTLFILLIRVAMRTVDCTWIDGEFRLDANREVLCFRDEWWQLSSIGFVMAVIYGFIIPFLLWKQLPYGDLQDEDMLKKFGWLYARYRPACYYYEFVVMAQKAAMAAATTFISNDNRLFVAWPLVTMITAVSLALQLKLMPFRESTLRKLKERPVRHIPLETIGEDGEIKKVQPKCHEKQWLPRPKPLTTVEQLQASLTSWKGVTPGLLLSRWGKAFLFPQALNSLEIIGLTVQLFVCVSAGYFGFFADHQGVCTVDGKPQTGVYSMSNCDNIWGAVWTPPGSTGTPRLIGILVLATPVVFLGLALVMIADNLFELKRQGIIRKREEALQGLQKTGRTVATAWGIIRSLKPGVNARSQGAMSPGRPSSAQRPQEIINRDTAKVHGWLRTQTIVSDDSS